MIVYDDNMSTLELTTRLLVAYCDDNTRKPLFFVTTIFTLIADQLGLENPFPL